jgi:hypothetical protein
MKPAATAPEVTSIISSPLACCAASSAAKKAILSRFKPPSSEVRELLPIFTTIRSDIEHPVLI